MRGGAVEGTDAGRRYCCPWDRLVSLGEDFDVDVVGRLPKALRAAEEEKDVIAETEGAAAERGREHLVSQGRKGWKEVRRWRVVHCKISGHVYPMCIHVIGHHALHAYLVNARASGTSATPKWKEIGVHLFLAQVGFPCRRKLRVASHRLAVPHQHLMGMDDTPADAANGSTLR